MAKAPKEPRMSDGSHDPEWIPPKSRGPIRIDWWLSICSVIAIGQFCWFVFVLLIIYKIIKF